jgi:sugar phosphate isomerase/epimerase
MLIGCGTVVFRKYSVKEAFSYIRKAGYEWVEVQATPPWCSHVNLDKDDPEKFKIIIREFGFNGVTAIWTDHGAIIPDNLSVEYGKRCIQWAAAADIPIVNIGDGFKPDGMSIEEAFDILETRILEMLEEAEKQKVIIAIEPHGTFSLSSGGLKKIMSISDSPWLGINYDMANIHRAGYVESGGSSYKWKNAGEKQDEVEVLGAIIHRVVHVHAKDMKNTDCVALGKGDVSVRSCISLLKEYGYKGAISLETEGDDDAQAAFDLIRTSREYLKSII